MPSGATSYVWLLTTMCMSEVVMHIHIVSLILFPFVDICFSPFWEILIFTLIPMINSNVCALWHHTFCSVSLPHFSCHGFFFFLSSSFDSFPSLHPALHVSLLVMPPPSSPLPPPYSRKVARSESARVDRHPSRRRGSSRSKQSRSRSDVDLQPPSSTTPATSPILLTPQHFHP